MSDLIQRATDYIKQNKHRVNPIFRPSFHLVPPIGWMNDPNGFIHYRGAYHLFYQYHPYSSAWGPMHWGHSVSTDLLRYSDAPIAMAPDHDDEHGCFSGGAVIEKNTGNLILMYTKHYEKGFVQERQNIAVSKDGFDL
jgi:beta-fructofuranosidase